MERLAQFFGPLRTLDPSRWVAFADQMPKGVAAVLIVAGVLAALFASHWAFRFVAAPVGLVSGLLASPAIASTFHTRPSITAWVATGLLGGAGAVYPPILVFGVCGGVGGLIGSALTGPEDFWLGFLPGAMLCGAAAMFGLRVVEAGVSGLFGGALLIWGLMRLAGLTGTLAGFPSLALGAVGVACLASMVFQLKVRSSPEDAAAAKAKRMDEKRRKQEDKERAERFASYTRKGRHAGESTDDEG